VVETLQSHGAQMSERGEFSLIQPVRLNNSYSMYAIRTEPGQSDRVIGEAEAALRRVALTPRQFKIETVAGDRVKRYRNERALAWMLIAVSVLLLLVTASGVVGMTTLRVAQRRKQIGVRRALGARKIDILRLFISENLIVTSAGVATGLVLAVAFNQLLVSQLELPKLPVPYLLLGAVLFLLLGIAAVYGPAWRAAGISPATATRST
jgi:putative ABC transport system permease protein